MAKGKGGAHARDRWPLAVLVIFALSGFLFYAGAHTSNGSDLRPAGDDVSSLLKERSNRINDLRLQAGSLRKDIDQLGTLVGDQNVKVQINRADKLKDVTGLSTVKGPGMRVVLTDAPPGVQAPGLDPNYLVVHQQDIQAFVNALWSGGAQAVTLQGERLISTTGIKCVGNTVVLDGVPYSPPYTIEAIGDQTSLDFALSTSSDVTTYGKYVRQYGLGLDVKRVGVLTAKPYAGTVGLKYATTVN